MIRRDSVQKMGFVRKDEWVTAVGIQARKEMKINDQ
jgi:hypothetical protein